jgi:hypothetical protein
MAKISVTTPFRLLIDDPLATDYDSDVFRTIAFQSPGVYEVSDVVANHWYTALNATIVDDSTDVTAVITPLEVGQ